MKSRATEKWVVEGKNGRAWAITKVGARLEAFAYALQFKTAKIYWQGAGRRDTVLAYTYSNYNFIKTN